MAVDEFEDQGPFDLRIGSKGIDLMAALRAQLAPIIHEDARYKPATNDEELKELVRNCTGMAIPDVHVCEGHCTPFEAFSAAYFATNPLIVWYASRGFGGKSVLLATLSLVEAISFGASVTLLGGSGKQSANVHEYMFGEELPNRFWKWADAPRHLLADNPTQSETKLTNHGNIQVLMASQTSVRGPHPQRLRLDEIDEMDMKIFDAALGQPMAARGVKSQTVASSTWHNPDGTMTEIIRRAQMRGYPVMTWCYRECLANGTGWLTEEMIADKKAVVTSGMWETEYELQEPSSSTRAIVSEKVEAMFDPGLGEFEGAMGEYIQIEPADPDGSYVTGADWAKELHHTVIGTFRLDVEPIKLVAFQREGRKPWPDMVADFERQVRIFNSVATHDGTGLGDVIDDYLQVDADAVVMVGRLRQELFSDWIQAIEHGEIIMPVIETLRTEHKYVRSVDLQSKHPPDGLVMCALAYHGAGGWSRGTGA